MVVAGTMLSACQSEAAGEWSYKGDNGPEAWGGLTSEFQTCSSGTVQSPIDIQSATIADLPALQFDYPAGALMIENTGYAGKVKAPEGGTLTVGDDEYSLLQFHFHAPSEEKIAGRQYAADMHLVHANVAGELAVVGVLFEEGEANPVFESLLSALPAEAGSATDEDYSLEPASLLPGDSDYFTYQGSLTTPPCSEGVRWIVMTEALTLSKEQVAAYIELFGETARPIQGTNEREIQLRID